MCECVDEGGREWVSVRVREGGSGEDVKLKLILRCESVSAVHVSL